MTTEPRRPLQAATNPGNVTIFAHPHTRKLPVRLSRQWASWLITLVLIGLTGEVGESAETIISEVRVSSKAGETEIEVTASNPLNYVLQEGTNPFSVTLLFLNATFAFPPREQSGTGALSRIAARILQRNSSQLAQLDLVFAEQAAYTVKPQGNRVRVLVKLPLRAGDTVWSKEDVALPVPLKPVLPQPVSPKTEPQAKPAPPRIEPPATGGDEQRGTILRLKAAGSAGSATVTVDAIGPLSYRTFVLERPPRVVIDFEGVRSEVRDPPRVANNSLLQRVRFSKDQEGVFRIVLDLRRIVPYRVERKANGIVIHVGTMTNRPD